MTQTAEQMVEQAMHTAETTPAIETDNDEDGSAKEKSQASLLVAFCTERVELFHDANRDTYAHDKATGETRRLGSNAFRDWLTATFFTETKKAVRDQSLREALNTLSGLARHQGECHEVHIRVAGKDGVYYLDLCEPNKARAIKISASGWEIITNPSVRFIRPETMRPLPEPERGGSVNDLWKIANIPTNARLLASTWLVECLRPDTPFTAQDLVDRTISIEVPILTTRMEVTELWKGYEVAQPKFLGALLDLMVGALKHLPTISLSPSERPRLIEFARLGMAIAVASGQDRSAFMKQFTAARHNALERTLDASPVATAIREWIEKNPTGGQNTAKGFMEVMEGCKPPHGEGWPRTPKGFADAMRRAAPALRQLGIECHSLPKTGGVILWEIRERRTDQSPECPASPTYEDNGATTGCLGHAGHSFDHFHSGDSMGH